MPNFADRMLSMKSTIRIYCILLLLAFTLHLRAQVSDTISNWDGIAANWQSWQGPIDVIGNPQPDTVNHSAHCIRVITTTDPYDLILLNLGYVVNFDEYPNYTMLCYPPAGGGDVVLKFENSDVTQSQEIRVTTTGGHWNLLKFNFTGLTYNNFTRMVIFFDFLGTASGKAWFFDDIVRHTPAPLQLDSNLPLVVINTFGSQIPDDPKINAHMGIISHPYGSRNNLNDTFNNYNGYIGIETRGQSSQMFPKKCYGLETRDSLGNNLDTTLLGLPEENDWILYGPYTDKSLLRDVFSYEIGHRMGEYCTRNVYCELVINNDYKGIYVLQEKIKKDKNRVDVATLNPDEVAGDDVTGGYILSVDKIPWDFEYGSDGWLSAPDPTYPNAMDITFQYYYPDPGEIVQPQRDYIRSYVTEAEKALIASNFKDPSLGYLRYLDAPSFVDFMLLSEISKEVDKYRYSTYFSKQKDSDGGKLFAGPAWDFNLGYGNVDYWDPGIDYSGWLYEMVNPWDYSIIYWWKRLMEDPYFRDLAKTRWTELRANKLSNENLDVIIDSITTLTEEARIRNYERWPILGMYVWPNYNWQGNDYDDEVNYFKAFLINRLHWMDNNMTGQVLQPFFAISAQNDKIFCSIQGDYFRHPILKKSHFTLNDAPAGLEITDVTYTGPAGCVLTLSGNADTHPDISVTIDKKILNTWDDLISNKLSSAGYADRRQADIRVSVNGGMIRLYCPDTDLLPSHATLYSVTGQEIKKLKLEAAAENTLPAPGVPGIYILKLTFIGGQQVYKIRIP